MGIAKIERTVEADGIPILIIIPNDTTSCKSIEFKIDDSPENTAYNCESECRDYLDLKIISALQVFITDNWEQIKPTEEESSTDDKGKKEEQTVKPSYQPRFTDEKLNFLAEAILIDGQPYWLISDAGAISVRKDAIPTGKRSKVEPLAKDQYLTKAYSFSSEEEVKHYVELANNLDLDTFYHMIKKVVRKYIDSNDFHTSIITLSIIFTYYQDRVGTTHYLFFVGPPNCGKTNNLTLFEEMAYRCMGSSGLTAPNIYEFLGGKEEGMGTIAEDEADDIDDSRDKMKVYKNGSRKGKPYHRIDTSSGRNQGKFYTFCFKAAAAERLPDPEKAGGLMQRIITINCRSGDPQYDISEVVNPMGDDNFEEHRQELNHVHKLLLIYRLKHFHKPIPNIYINLKNREKQLFKPILRIFQGTRIQETIRDILTEFVNKKRRENMDSLLAFLYLQIKRLVDEHKRARQTDTRTIDGSKTVSLSFKAIWLLITNPDIDPGKHVPNKPNSYDSDEFGILSVKEIGAKIRVLGGELPKHQGKERVYVFTEDTMDRLAKLYGDSPEVKISLEKPSPDPTPTVEDDE